MSLTGSASHHASTATRRCRWVRHGTPSGACSRQLAATIPTSIRDHAIIVLLSVYGVRSGEVRRLRLDDIYWLGNRIRFIRSKSGRHEEAPLVARVGNAIARYLREARPQSASRVVFLRLRAPFTPLSPSGLYSAVKSHLPAQERPGKGAWATRAAPRLCPASAGVGVELQGGRGPPRAPRPRYHPYLRQGQLGHAAPSRL